MVSLLERAVGQGMLGLDEFSERSDAALAARTRGELNVVLVDLPGLVHAGGLEDSAPERVVPTVLRASMSELKRRGPWQVPRALLVRNRMGSTLLDFTEARIEHREVSIELDVVAGSVKVLVPMSASVLADDVEVTMGEVKDRRRQPDDGQGQPRIVLTGQVRMGSVEIKIPRHIRRLFGGRRRLPGNG